MSFSLSSQIDDLQRKLSIWAPFNGRSAVMQSAWPHLCSTIHNTCATPSFLNCTFLHN